MDWFEKIVWFIVALFVILIAVGIYYDFAPEKITLTKSEWECVKSHDETTTFFIMVGKIMMPQTNINRVCDEYKRK